MLKARVNERNRNARDFIRMNRRQYLEIGRVLIYQLDSMARSGREVPDAFLASGIRMRIIGAQYLAEGGADLVLAAALFAVVSVFVKREPIVASAHV